MTLGRILPALCAAAMIGTSGCAGSRREVRLTREPSIERALDLLARSPAAASLIKFLREKPIRFEYSDGSAACNRFSFKIGTIFLPRGLKNRDPLLAMALARGAYVHRLRVLSGLEEVISEEEEIAALFQARIGLAIGVKDGDFGKDKASQALKSDFCTYIMEGSRAALLAARTAALSVQPECQRPLDTLQARRMWMDEIRAAIDDNESFFQLMKAHDLLKVRKGTLTMNEAMKNDAEIRALPTYELYRRQRAFYDSETDIFAKINGLYDSAVKDDETWHSLNQALIDRARRDFSACNLPE